MFIVVHKNSIHRWISLMPKTCHTYLHGSGIKEITPRPRCIKIIKLNINILRGEKQNQPSCALAEILPWLPSLLMRTNDLGTA